MLKSKLALILTAALTLVMFTGNASAKSPCESLGDIAEFVMAHRQAGAHYNDFTGGKSYDKLVDDLIIYAYKVKVQDTTEDQLEAISTFREKVEKACYEVRSVWQVWALSVRLVNPLNINRGKQHEKVIW